MTDGETDVDAKVRAACERGDIVGATTLALRHHGPLVLGFLFGMHREKSTADDAFSLFAERVWKGLAQFKWDASLRTWLYVVARHASADVARALPRKHLHSPLSDADVSQIAEHVRTETKSILKTAKRDAFAELRDELPEADRALLILRVDRDMAFLEIAEVFGAKGTDDLTREAARLRKRYQHVKDRLRENARARGLL